MSDVRLSNGSPTLERTDARFSDHPKPSACRNLFGSVDHEELRRDLKGHLLEMEEASSAKWNFDFHSHIPLSNGKLDWELVDCKDIPNFYRAQRSANKSGNNLVDLNGNHHRCVLLGERENTQRSENNSQRSDSQMDCKDGQQRKRPACHDPSSQNKRSHTSSEDEVCLCPPALSQEHTPRKTNPKTTT